MYFYDKAERLLIIKKMTNLKKNLNLEGLRNFAEEFKSLLKQPQILLLEGPLGAGKTTFVRFLFDVLEKDCGNQKEKEGKTKGSRQVVSPAFTIHHIYHTSLGMIQHIDLYRLKNDEDLESTGFWDIFSEPEKNNLIIIEWADLLNPNCLPLEWNYIKIVFSFEECENTRSIRWEFCNGIVNRN